MKKQTTKPTYSQLKNELMQGKLTEIFNDLGVFFAFSEEQMEKGLKKINAKRKDCISISGGGFMPRKNAKEYIKRSSELMGWLVREVKKLDSVKVIKYELANYECYYTGDLTDAVEALKDYSFTVEQISRVYKLKHNKAEEVKQQ